MPSTGCHSSWMTKNVHGVFAAMKENGTGVCGHWPISYDSHEYFIAGLARRIIAVESLFSKLPHSISLQTLPGIMHNNSRTQVLIHELQFSFSTLGSRAPMYSLSCDIFHSFAVVPCRSPWYDTSHHGRRYREDRTILEPSVNLNSHS
jgi:hypothetical protein